MIKIMILWGEEHNRKFSDDEDRKPEDYEDCIQEYEFETKAEADAFIYGVSEGEGWFEAGQVEVVDGKLEYV